MLGLSDHKISKYINNELYSSLVNIDKYKSSRNLIRTLFFLLIAMCCVMFLPWTQNINTSGFLTTLLPDERPQTIHSVIAGQIENWYVQEGDYVEKGDTIVHIREVKDDYFDPNLLLRTQQQIEAKQNSVSSYQSKINATDAQIEALKVQRTFKLQNIENKILQYNFKVTTDSIDYEVAKLNFSIVNEQFTRAKELYESGLNSLTEFEKRKQSFQKAEADLVSKNNKLLTTRNELNNVILELSSIEADFNEKISKSDSERFSAFSNLYEAEAEIAKLENKYANLSYRNDLYNILAPQSGYVTKTIQTGIGETFKEGAEMVSIMPAKYNLAVEMYVRPIDLPLLKKGQDVRIQFDGWPAIVFSGWPNTSIGTYGGRVFAIDNFISQNGMYRILVEPDSNDKEWPNALRFGSGANSIVLLNDVPIWYEIWRNLNGFPPDYYASSYGKDSKNNSKEKK